MKKFLSIIVAVVVLVALFFLPLFPVTTPPLSAGVIFHYSRVGGVAGFFDKILITETGEIRSESPIKKPNDLTSQQLNSDQLSSLKEYITERNYTPVRISLFNKLTEKYEDGKVYPDALSRLAQIRSASKTIEIREDEYVVSLLKEIGI